MTIENAGTISQSTAISSQIAPELLAALPPEFAGQLTGTAGIFARTGAGALSVNNSGSITAATGIDVGVLGGGATAGPLSISNTGTITGTTGPAINAVGVSAAQISNSGTINGFLSLNTSAPSVFNNLAGGLFATSGTSNFGAGNISNQGQITLANGSVLNNVGQFTNSGTVATGIGGANAGKW